MVCCLCGAKPLYKQMLLYCIIKKYFDGLLDTDLNEVNRHFAKF